MAFDERAQLRERLGGGGHLLGGDHGGQAAFKSVSAIVDLAEQAKTLRRELEGVAPLIPGIGAPPDEALGFHLLDLACHGRGVDAELAGEIHDSDIAVGAHQEAHQGEAGRRHADPTRETGHEHLMCADDLAQEMGFVSAMAQVLRVGRLLGGHVQIVHMIIDDVNDVEVP